MTVRVTTLKGVEAGRYYTERLPSYYVSGVEPPGRWWGRAADQYGLQGRLDVEAFHAVLAGLDPDTGDHLGRRFGDDSVRGYDATFSAPKSVSLLWAFGDERLQDEVVESHERAVDAVLGWVEDHAHTRLRRHGHVINVDAGGLIVGVFRQHTSRKLDPQLHTHAVIANRVPAPDGRWLALDARTIKYDQRTLSALYHASLRSELTRRLGAEWEPVENGSSEVAGIPTELRDEFSQRTRDLQARLEVKRRRFVESMGREPDGREAWRLEREAVLDSRPAKPAQPSFSELRDEWRERAQHLGLEPDRVIRQVLGRRLHHGDLTRSDVERLAGTALEALADRQSSWRPAELLRELAAATPTHTTVDAADLTRRLETLAGDLVRERCTDLSKQVPAGVELRRDRRPVTEPAVNRALTTQHILDQEQQIISWAERSSRRGNALPVPDRVILDRNPQLSAGQVEAVKAVAGNRGLELIVGPAGTGKTTALKTAVDLFNQAGEPVFGVAPTAAAAQVLADETGMAADTLDKLLIEHDQSHRPPQLVFDLPAGTTVVLDEAGTASTPNLARLAQLTDEKGWRVVMVGDPRQFNAVGRGGMFTYLTQQHDAVHLDEVHRFIQDWERKASLRLRSGDPTVLAEYDRQGRLHGGTLEDMEAEVIAAWQQARHNGKTVALMCHSRETVDRLNQKAQQIRIQTGELNPDTPSVKADGVDVWVGDEVLTRRNDRRLQTDNGMTVKNRDHWTITGIHIDGSISITGESGNVRLPSGYVSEYVELGYAQTAHASQGRTVDVSLTLVDGTVDSRGIYTPLTRGRDSNQVYVALEANQTEFDVLTQAVARDWADQPATTRQQELVTDRQLDRSPEDEQMVQLQRALAQARERQERRQRLDRSKGLSLGL